MNDVAAVSHPSPSPSQRRAIEAPPHAVLVLAGPGAGKTFCLTERIRYLIEHHHVDPARICAFTFTNKAAGEITERLATRLGDTAARITCGTLHAFCATLLREFGEQVGLTPGFGIADEDYQLSVLRRLEGHRKWHRRTLSAFSAHRFRGDLLRQNDQDLFVRYERFLRERRLVDFDLLVMLAARLLDETPAGEIIRGRFDVVLVDEFQDLNPVQYRVVRALARGHGHVFAVGDDDQSIYSWAGADPAVFRTLVNDFGITSRIHLEENRRCPQDVFALARRLVTVNTPIFADRVPARADRVSEFAVQCVAFENAEDEAAWIVNDIRADREAHGHAWGDVGVLYRMHTIGHELEGACLTAGVPCRLAHGKALADDPVVAYVLAAVRVIAAPDDELRNQAFFRTVLPTTTFDEALAKSEENALSLLSQLSRMAAQLPRADETARRIKRALADRRNLVAIGKQQASLATLVQDLLSRKVGVTRSVLDDHADEIVDPASLPDVVRLAQRLRDVRARATRLRLPALGGAEIPLARMLNDVGVKAIRPGIPYSGAVEDLAPDEVRSVDFPLGVFKAAQFMEMRDASLAFTNFTAVDLETTHRDIRVAEIVEIAAVRVRNGVVTEHFSSLVRPRQRMEAGAIKTHGITEAMLADAPTFESIWPQFRAFIGSDTIVAHNGYEFDFRILHRMAAAAGFSFDVTTFDTLPLARDLFPTSRKLVDLAAHFGIPSGQSHRALDDTIALARVTLALGEVKIERARKTALSDQLGNLGVALAAYAEDAPGEEGMLFRTLTTVAALGRYSGALEHYETERGDDDRLPSVDDLIMRLGGPARMEQIRATRSADDRYPQAMRRLRRLIGELPAGTFETQLTAFLERAVLSQNNGVEADRDRVNLLTLHSTKGLEFSRVYVVGVEDAQLPGGSPSTGPSAEEVEEGRRLLYVGMTRTIDRLVLTTAAFRNDKPSGGHQFLSEMGLAPAAP